MKFLILFLLLFFAVFGVFGQESENSEDLQNVEILQESKTDDTAVAATERKKIKNHRYIVVSAIMMMLFIGLCMASASTINPE